MRGMSWLGRPRVKQRLVLYHGLMPIYMEFSDDAEETFSRALRLLVVRDVFPIILLLLQLNTSHVQIFISFLFGIRVRI